MFPKLCALLAAGCLLTCSASFAAPPAAAEDPVALLQAAYARAVTPGEQADLHRELFATVFERVQRSYPVEVDLRALTAAAVTVIEPLAPGSGDPAQVFSRSLNAALGTLDRHSRYVDPRTQAKERSDSGGFGGLGLEIEPAESGPVRVLAPFADSPAARAGLQAGDLIVRVDDQPLAGVPMTDAISRMRGAPGTQVSLTIRRTGLENEIHVSLTRDTIKRQLLRWSMEGEVLVLRLGSFNGPVSATLQKAVAEATAAARPRGIVLDLRGNPGGSLREAVTAADAFLSQGEIVSLRGRTPGNQRSWRADPEEMLPGLPLVVLIDRRSASASELVAAALQENGRATVMGERSVGKGTVQTTFTLGKESHGELRLTTAYYYGPSGRSVQRIGVAPDVELLPATPRSTPGEGDARAAAPASAAARVDQERCAKLVKAADAALSCAVGYVLAGDVDAFLSRVGAARP
jgi:C-terminal peptidase prc